MQSTEEFSAFRGIGQLVEKMVEMKKKCFISIGLLIGLHIIERVFLVMNIIKNRLRNQIGDQWMNDCLVTYIEKDIFKTIKCEEIMQRFQNMKNR